MSWRWLLRREVVLVMCVPLIVVEMVDTCLLKKLNYTPHQRYHYRLSLSNFMIIVSSYKTIYRNKWEICELDWGQTRKVRYNDQSEIGMCDLFDNLWQTVSILSQTDTHRQTNLDNGMHVCVYRNLCTCSHVLISLNENDYWWISTWTIWYELVRSNRLSRWSELSMFMVYNKRHNPILKSVLNKLIN